MEKIERMEKLMGILGIDQFLDELLRALSSEELESFADYISKNHGIEEEELKWIIKKK